MLQKTKGATKNGQSTSTANIGHNTQNDVKQNKKQKTENNIDEQHVP